MDRTDGDLYTNFPIHEAAIKGDYEAARRALESGADINALDHSGRTVIACAVAGEDWEDVDASEASLMSKSRLKLLKALLSHSRISLFTLNSPQSALKGVTPLGMASWLNIPDVVYTLLEDSAEAVSVDGMDSYGATALMYAARDGNLAVVQHLLSHGARPDFRDMNHRTSIQYSLPHAQVLWLCEAVLRRHRCRENSNMNTRKLFAATDDSVKLAWEKIETLLESHHVLLAPPATSLTHELTSLSTQALINCIASSDLSSLQSLLSLRPSPPTVPSTSSALLVNLPDRNGWSPIHHCVSVCPPSIHVLDGLYAAGSDISLFTTVEHYTPLHVLALSAHLPAGSTPAEYGPTLNAFAIHLIRDLQAPLSAKDKEDETCIHIAAEKGKYLDLLIAFLECDSTGQVRQMRNSRGLTAFEVAKPQFRSAFGVHRTVSSISMRTVRPRLSMTSLSSAFAAWTPILLSPNENSSSSFDLDVSSSIQTLLYNLRITSPGLQHEIPRNNNPTLLDNTEHLANQIISHFCSIREQAQEELTEARAAFESALRELGVIKKKVKDGLDHKGLVPLDRSDCGGRRSGDSQATAVSLPSEACSLGPFRATESTIGCTNASASSSLPRRSGESSRPRFMHWPGWLDHFFPDSPSFKSHFSTHVATEPTHHDRDTSSISKSLTRKDAAFLSGTVRLTTWLKKKVKPEPLLGSEFTIEKKAKNIEVAPESSLPYSKKGDGTKPFGADASIEKVLRTAHIVLGAANRDLGGIKDVIIAADEHIKSADQSISRVEHIVQKALKKRRRLCASDIVSSIDNAPLSPAVPFGISAVSPVEAFGYLPSPPSSAGHMSSTFSSARSSNVSLASTLGEFDDWDTKALRGLLLRQIEARLCGAFDEIDKTTSWLQIVNEVVRGVRRRAYL